MSHVERFLPLYAPLCLAGGIILGANVPAGDLAVLLLDRLVDAYGVVAPLVIYLILAPSIIKMLHHDGGRAGHFAVDALFWFARVRLAACLFGLFGAAIVFRVPLSTGDELHPWTMLGDTIRQLGTLLTESSYFVAIGAAIVTVVALGRSTHPLVRWFVSIPLAIERAGNVMVYAVPPLMFLVGIYIPNISGALAERFHEGGAEGAATVFGAVDFLGWTIGTGDASGILVIYGLIALVTGVIGTSWHVMLLCVASARVSFFAFGVYFKEYFVRIYPLLWATSSEALSSPLNMYLIKRIYPRIDEAVRRFAVGSGTVLNVNGTLICCFVVTPVVAQMIGHEVSVLQLLVCLPLIYILSFGVPGIPGELILFAGPIMEVLGVPEASQGKFLIAFIGLQIGLPDSFRTATNSTETAVAALLLNERYRRMEASSGETDPK